MKPFKTHVGLPAPLMMANIDTDAIMPKQFLKSIKRTGYGDFIFDEWRYLDKGESGMDCSKRRKNPDFSLNQPRYQGASILVTGENFGCGSSREHAPWGLLEYGFKVIIAPSFADIFYNNSIKNGILPITLKSQDIEALVQDIQAHEGDTLAIDLDNQTVVGHQTFSFDIEPQVKKKLLSGLDDIAETLLLADKIATFEAEYKKKYDWLFDRGIG